jgi:Rubisco LSMT substrate-binding
MPATAPDYAAKRKALDTLGIRSGGKDPFRIFSSKNQGSNGQTAAANLPRNLMVFLRIQRAASGRECQLPKLLSARKGPISADNEKTVCGVLETVLVDLLAEYNSPDCRHEEERLRTEFGIEVNPHETSLVSADTTVNVFTPPSMRALNALIMVWSEKQILCDTLVAVRTYRSTL